LSDFPLSTFGKVSKKELTEIVSKKMEVETQAQAALS